MPRVTDIYAALPSITGKFELEYEGELKGADAVARELISRRGVNVFDGYFPDADARSVVEWFDLGGTLNLGDTRLGERGRRRRRAACRGCSSWRIARHRARRPGAALASAVDFVLEGLYAQKKIGRSDERGYPRHRTGPAAARGAARPCSRRTTTRSESPGEEEAVLQLVGLWAGASSGSGLAGPRFESPIGCPSRRGTS